MGPFMWLPWLLPSSWCNLYKALLFAVCMDTNLQKMVLTCTQVALSMWKVKYLSDTESEPGLSSEDEAEGLPPHWAVARRLPAHHGGAPFQSPGSQPAAASTVAGMYLVTLITKMIAFYYLTSNYVVASPVTFFRYNLVVLLPVVGTPMGMNTDEGAILEPHQMAVDRQDLRRLHHLTVAMLGGMSMMRYTAVLIVAGSTE